MIQELILQDSLFHLVSATTYKVLGSQQTKKQYRSVQRCIESQIVKTKQKINKEIQQNTFLKTQKKKKISRRVRITHAGSLGVGLGGGLRGGKGVHMT